MKKERFVLLAVIVVACAVCLAVSSPAQARDSWGFSVSPGGVGFSYGHGHGYGGYWGHRGGYYGGFYAPRAYYSPPPVYYAPRVYYGPPAYYGPVGYGWYGGCYY
ncbi:MAG: hypothetical protein KC978_22410 [Candidatus Omnitrophica bacterium]|nr:hypothetical protein [Candidatus Omnitrophota bacterium]